MIYTNIYLQHRCRWVDKYLYMGSSSSENIPEDLKLTENHITEK